MVSLGEGSTPLVRAPRLGAALGVDLWLKLEGLNPTGSFKDRGMTLALSKAAEEGATAVVCASTGNTSASAAAYAARAGIRCVVVVPSGNIALGKLAQALVHGARVASIEGSFDDALRLVRDLAERHPITLVNNLNPYRLEGQKTAAWEVVEELGGAPDWLALPGRQRRQHHGLVARVPRARERRRRRGACRACWARRRRARRRWSRAATSSGRRPWRPPSASARRCAATEAAAAASESGGGFVAVPDEEILGWFRRLAARGGRLLRARRAPRASPGSRRARAAGQVPEGARVVCVLTGNGLKDPDTALRDLDLPPPVPARREAIERIALA